MSRKLEIKKNILYNLYIKKSLSTYKIARKFKCWNTTIGKRLKEYGIKLRNPKRALRPDRKFLRSLYIKEKLSTYVIAEKLKCNPGTVRKWLIIYRIPIRKKKFIKISKNYLENLYYKKRLSLKKIGKLQGFTAPGIFKTCRKFGMNLRTGPETSKYYLQRANFNNNKTSKAYLIGFRVGDLHVRQNYHLIKVGMGTTKKVQLKLFISLFKNYGKVYIGGQDKREAWHPEVYLNRSFNFLVPKYRKIPQWVCESKRYFLNFLAGYTDAEGNIGCYPRARFKLASYDYGILRDMGKYLKKYFQIFPTLNLEKNDRMIHNKDTLVLRINRMSSLLKILTLLKPLLKHKKRKNDLNIAIQNIKLRLNRNVN